MHASLPLLLQLDRQGEGEKTMVLPLRRLSSREQPFSGPDDPDEGAASAMERWVRELPRTGGVLGADARDASETAQEVLLNISSHIRLSQSYLIISQSSLIALPSPNLTYCSFSHLPSLSSDLPHPASLSSHLPLLPPAHAPPPPSVPSRLTVLLHPSPPSSLFSRLHIPLSLSASSLLQTKLSCSLRER